MHRFLVRVLVPGAVCVAVSAVGVTGVHASPGISRSQGPAGAPAPTALASPGPGSQLWAERYGTTGFENTANAVKVSPDGGTVFVTGSTDPPSGGVDYATIAYNATTGAQLWIAGYNDPHNFNDVATSLAVSPSGGTVFVTGKSGGESGGVSSYDYATIAYNATTGAQLWAARYNGPGNGDDKASSVVVSPDGRTVFVTGESAQTSSVFDYATRVQPWAGLDGDRLRHGRLSRLTRVSRSGPFPLAPAWRLEHEVVAARCTSGHHLMASSHGVILWRRNRGGSRR